MFDKPEKIVEESHKKKQKRDSSSESGSLSPDEDIEDKKEREYKRRRITYSEDIDVQTKLKSYLTSTLQLSWEVKFALQTKAFYKFLTVLKQ